MLNIVKIVARDLPDLWFQTIYQLLEQGRKFTIDKGSYAGETRLEFDYFIGHVLHPGTKPLLPDIPPALGIPNPVDEAYIYGGEGYDRSYIEYIMSPRKEPGESYTYGERLTKAKIPIEKLELSEELINKSCLEFITDGFLNQIEYIIWSYKNEGYRNNQLVLQVAEPSDHFISDPPCLRSIDSRIQDGKLHFFVYFRSWDLMLGAPANLAAIQELKAYMASEIGVEDGEMIVESKGGHIYGYAEEIAKIRCYYASNK